ncbi:MAG: hypothetical protein QOD99_1112 [Chthoniobacter sp.]|jgi:GxxExxY protein|nr:hypothetical protein [Chthoniobacter sp.]
MAAEVVTLAQRRKVAKEMQRSENELAAIIVDSAYQIHTELGPGLLESVYEVVLTHELQSRGLRVERQVAIPIQYRGLRFEVGFRADLMVEESVIVEIKSVEENHAVHKKQLLTQLRLTGKRLGLVLNFGLPRIKDGIARVVNGLPDSQPTPDMHS